MRGRRISARAALRALAVEQLIIGGTREPETSHGENVIQARGKAAGDRVLGRTQRILDRLARKADRLRALQATLRIRARYRDGDIVPHPDGGVRTVTQTAAEQEALHKLVAEDIDRGSRRHRRLPAVMRQVPKLVFGADALLLLYFFSGVTNVDWTIPLSAALVFAALLAVMVTGISFAFFRFTGDRLQQYKDDTGIVPLRGLDDATNVSMGLAGGAMVILAALMFVRMRAEVITALGPHAGFTAVIIGLALALVSVLANTLVIAVHALDGSAETDRLEAFGGVVGPAKAEQHQLDEQAAILDPQIAIIAREAERAAADGITAAGLECAIADQIIEASRTANQGTGPLSEPAINPNDEDGVIGYRRTDATPEIDERPLHITLGHLRTPLPGAPGDEQQDGDQEQPAA
jgi:hypothetical protein